MNTRYSFMVFGGALIVGALIYSAIIVYSQQDLKRFKASLEKSSRLAVSPENTLQRDTVITERSEYIAPPITAEPEHLENRESEAPEMEIEVPWTDNTDMPTLDSDWDESSLSEVISPDLIEEPVEGIDYTYPEYSHSAFLDLLKPVFGDSEDVDIVAEGLNRWEAGNATRDDVINMAEAWLRILPKDQYENRQSVTKFLEDEYELKRHVESTYTEVIKVEFGITPSAFEE